MKKAQLIALWVWLGLMAITGVLGIAVYQYGTICFWAAAFAAGLQSLLAGLAWWGLRLARQQAAMVEEAGAATKFTPLAPLGSFHMSYEDHVPKQAPVQRIIDPEEITSLDTGFQRVIIALSAFLFLALAAVIGYMVWHDFAAVGPGQSIIISPNPIDPGAVVAAGAALLVYFLLISFSRVTAETEGYGDASHGIVLLGLPGTFALLAAVIAAWMNVAYATQIGAIFIGIVLLLQALELGVNSVRNHGAIEELDQPGVDLQQLPLVPMLTSGWLVGLHVLVTEIFSVTGPGATWTGAFARVLPRVVLFGAIVLIFLSTIHIVPTGEVGILQHLGTTTPENLANPLPAGIHILYPWPIDKIEDVPISRINAGDISTEEFKSSALGPMAFSFWDEHLSTPGDEILTGDVNSEGTIAPELLDGTIAVWWRVKNAGQYFHNVSNEQVIVPGNQLIEYGINATDTQLQDGIAMNMDQVLVHQVAMSAITSTFSHHTLNQVLSDATAEVTAECRQEAQRQLDALNSGIEIVDLGIWDIHPPAGEGEIQTPEGPQLPPAGAYEDVDAKHEYMQQLIVSAVYQAIQLQAQALGYSNTTIAEANAYADAEVKIQTGESNAIKLQSGAFSQAGDAAANWEFYRALQNIFPDITKVILGPNVTPPEIWQLGRQQGEEIMMPPESGSGGGIDSGMSNNPSDSPQGQ
ncbi:MAG TPA: SPFH domain-containing protein [Phycisphaerae bacterium]|nr:SPFH domain-containing protein [Phycisphaerae bacterium]